jgi:aminopeptidase N
MVKSTLLNLNDMKKIGLFLAYFYLTLGAEAQIYTHQDSLRGSITKERAWWDLQKYSLLFDVNPTAKSISGSNVIRYKVIAAHQLLQLDLQAPMTILSVTQDGIPLVIKHEGNAHFVELIKKQVMGSQEELVVSFSGRPRVAKNPPWDGGFTWKKDENNNPFIATSCQEVGASLWWPCKDHMYDEPDLGMLISVTVPKGLVAVSNGRLKEEDQNNATSSTYVWEVKNPINNYGVNINIGNYVHFSEVYAGEKGPLDMDYWVLKENLEKAKIQFKDAKRMMEAFEHWFGPYPFYEDSYKLVEVPYLGMEHQSSVTYGNKFNNGYLGSDLSGTGWGKKFDYIIIHESGHEWFANNITAKDNADLYIHESFTTYSEALFVEYFYGKTAGFEYVRGLRPGIANNSPLIGNYDVNDPNNSDIYSKGSNVLHTLRQLVGDDDKWREILRGLNKQFYHQTVSSQDIESYIASSSGVTLDAFFDQYLRDARMPIFQYKIEGGNRKKLSFRWSECIDGFDMRLKIKYNNKVVYVYPTTKWSSIALDTKCEEIIISKEYYVGLEKIN